MNKFRKWFFKFLTGYELVDYRKILDDALAVHSLNKQIIDDSKRTLDLAKDVNARCLWVIERCEELRKNETLG